MDRIRLSDHFTYRRLLRFVAPSIVMMVFTSIYGVVDGLFVSNFAGKTAFAAVNLIMPFPMLLGTLGFMFGTGGSALVAKTLGMGHEEDAQRYFSMLIYTTLIGGICITIIGQIVLEPVAIRMGASPEMLPICLRYGRILLLSVTFFTLQNIFQSFLVTAEKPGMGLRITILAGLTNMFLDFLFVGVFGWAEVGAAIATAVTETMGGLIPLIYFMRKNDSRLHLVKTKIEGRILLKASLNGSSEFMTNVSISLVNILYNRQLMDLAGENGVAAYGVIMYVCFIFIGIFVGYSIGSAPLVSYQYGAENHRELHNLFTKSLRLIAVAGLLMVVAANLLSGTLAGIFVGYDAELFALTRRAFCLYSLAFLLMGFNIYGSAFFTALNNGPVSAAISFLRTLVFQIAALYLLPRILGIDGIWLSVFSAEMMSLFVTTFFLRTKKNFYLY